MNVEIINKYSKFSTSYYEVEEVVEDSYDHFHLKFLNGMNSQFYNKHIYKWRKLDDKPVHN